MNQELWDNIVGFDFDSPPSEYGFSTRLANENYWTKTFTKLAIEEYKKFMYLAATSELMVSPSEIIDTVWHQHLIFTQSYQAFCTIAGKQIQHIPSTHNKEEAQRFQQAKERTTQLYGQTFGPQPKSIWGYHDMFDSLHLTKARMKIRGFLVIGILAFIALTIPAYFLLRPLYVQLNNPAFLFGLSGLAVVVFLGLALYNRHALQKIARQFDPSSFMYHLTPYELVYLKTQSLHAVINGTLNELIENRTITVNADKTLTLAKNNNTITQEQLQVTSALHELGTTYYPLLLRKLLTKPLFWNFANSLDAFRKYVAKSKQFGRLFYFNFTVLALLLLLFFTRLVTGLVREKPALLIAALTVVLAAAIVLFLGRLTKQVSTGTIPHLYKKTILPTLPNSHTWPWIYFLSGDAALATTFIPLVTYAYRSDAGGASSGGSCGSSCGSSCSSCGGCGGGD